MTITREQLELAARAAGLQFGDKFGEFFWCSTPDDGDVIYRRNANGTVLRWFPLTDHGQLLDLAMACGMSVEARGRIWYDVGQQHRGRSFEKGDFPSLAESVITAAAEQQLAKEKQ